MAITLNGSTGITSPEVTLDNTSADGGQVVLKSSGYDNWNLDNYSGRLRAYNGSTERMTIDTSGNVGIGTSSPSYKLDVNTVGGSQATARLIGNDQSNCRLRIENNGSGGRTWELIGGLAGANNSNFSIYDVTGSATRMTIDSSGNLLIGATSSQSGIARTAINFDSGSQYGLEVKDAGAGSTGTLCIFYRGSSLVGTITTNGSSTAYNTSSDYRLKENIAPMAGALAKVQALKPVTYTWKSTGEADEGFIAHELAEVCPSAVTGEKDAVDTEGNPVYQGIDTSFLVATLTAAIQEQQAIITDLKARIETLENK